MDVSSDVGGVRLAERTEALNKTIVQYAARIEAGDKPPTVDGKPISDFPVEVVNKPDPDFAVVLSAGDPDVRVHSGGNGPGGQPYGRLTANWGSGEVATRRGHHLDVFLKYFIENA